MILKNIIKARQAIIIVNIWAIFKKPRSVFVLETFKNSIKNLDNDIKINIKIEIKPGDNLLNIDSKRNLIIKNIERLMMASNICVYQLFLN